MTTENFLQYLESLNLFRWSITETESAFEANISMGTVPDLKNFTMIRKDEDGTYRVRLAKVDLFNEAITNGFFIKLANEDVWLDQDFV